MLATVIRALHILSLVLFLCLQAGSLALPVQSICEQTSGCCTPEPGCDESCAHCWCCATRTVSLTPVMTAKPADTPLARAAVLATVSPPPPPPTDILHVPKSV